MDYLRPFPVFFASILGLLFILPASEAQIQGRPLEKLFKEEFEDHNTGDLHMYARADGQSAEDYFFTGDPILPKYSDFLTPHLRQYVTREGHRPEAVFSLRSPDQLVDHYLIKVPADDEAERLVLYDYANQTLKKIGVMAYHKCTEQYCRQLDSWLLDINRDTRLDLVQKEKKVNKNRNREVVQTTIWLANQQGHFQKVDDADIDLSDFKMAELH